MFLLVHHQDTNHTEPKYRSFLCASYIQAKFMVLSNVAIPGNQYTFEFLRQIVNQGCQLYIIFYHATLFGIILT